MALLLFSLASCNLCSNTLLLVASSVTNMDWVSDSSLCVSLSLHRPRPLLLSPVLRKRLYMKNTAIFPLFKINIHIIQKSLQISNFMKIRPVGQAEGQTGGWTDWNNEANSRFSKLRESAKQNEEEIFKSYICFRKIPHKMNQKVCNETHKGIFRAIQEYTAITAIDIM